MKKTLFTILLQPIEAIIASISEIIDHESNSQKLFFADFVNKLIFGYVYQVSSLRNLSLELKTNPICRAVGLGFTPFSTLKDGFSRFQSKHFKHLFESISASLNLSQVPCLHESGVFRVIDGSLFPTLLSMNWTNYRKTKNAFKLHLSFELNRMIPTEFWVGTGNSSERAFLESVLESGVTYIADRGYFSFALADKVLQKQAFFVFRGRDNLLYEVVEKLITNDLELPPCFCEVTDEKVIFTGDERRNNVRLITFRVAGSYFRLITNRFDLTTLKVIILYAYRWQIELFFKFMKRTMTGIHLFNHSQNGVEIQFYVLMSVAILMLKLKQESQKPQKKTEKAESAKENMSSPSEWIKDIAKVFYQSWKISKNWLTVVKNSLAQVADNQLLEILNGL
jgi:Transposase DDE domain